MILKLQSLTEFVTPIVLSTGQHREMLDQVLATFNIRPDEDLALMEPGQTLASMSAKQLTGLDNAFAKFQPDYVFAQGDTTTTFVASLSAFYKRIPFGHIEAGLRTHNISNPFPEEFNRRATALITTHHFAPTEQSAQNLFDEGIRENVFVTGNTGIDAVKFVAERLPQTWFPDHVGRVVTLTTHRRENWGAPQRHVAEAALEIVERFKDVLLVVPMHKNPVVRETLGAVLSGHDRVALIEPPEYESFVKLMQRSTLILSDSGGVQEEAPAFGVPVLVLRDTTERPEGLAVGACRLVGTDRQTIINAATEELSKPDVLRVVASPYGDGFAAERIVRNVCAHFGISLPE